MKRSESPGYIINYIYIYCRALESNTVGRQLDSTRQPIDNSINNQGRRLFKLIVRAYDLGTPSLHNDVEIRIFVLDVNDHGPRFQQDVYRVKIPENIKGGTSIIKVSTRRHMR